MKPSQRAARRPILSTAIRTRVASFSAGVLLSVAALAQETSAGRNLPGLVPQPPLPPERPAAPALESGPLRATLRTIGRPHKKPLKKIVFTSNPAHAAAGPESVTTGGVALLEATPGFVQSLTARYIGEPLTADTAGNIARYTLEHYYAAERPVVFIQPLEVNYTTGVVKVGVLESRLDTVSAQGARWSSNDALARHLRIQPGDYINREQLLNDLSWVNENSFLKSNIMLQPGAQPGTTAIRLEVQDRFPIRAYAGVENTGSRQSGEWRWLAGINAGAELFGQFQQLSYQFSAPFDDPERQPVHAVTWSTSLPWHHRFSISGSYAGSSRDLAPQLGVRSLSYGGAQWQLSPRYSIPIGKLYGPLQQTVSFGADWKRSDLEYRQDGVSVPTNETDVVQLALSYDLKHQDSSGEVRFSMDGYWSPGGLSRRNARAAYREADPRLRPDYVYGVARLGRTRNLPKGFTLSLDVEGHLASTTLPSSEQLAIGGYGTVRGYEERIAFGDSGVIANLELRTPPVSVGQWVGQKSAQDQLQLLAFCDVGVVSNKRPLPSDSRSQTLASVGVGARYRYRENMTIRADLGFPLIDPDLGVDIAPRLSLGVLISY